MRDDKTWEREDVVTERQVPIKEDMMGLLSGPLKHNVQLPEYHCTMQSYAGKTSRGSGRWILLVPTVI